MCSRCLIITVFSLIWLTITYADVPDHSFMVLTDNSRLYLLKWGDQTTEWLPITLDWVSQPFIAGFAVSPDRQKMALVADDADGLNLSITAIDGSFLTRLTSAARMAFPQYGPLAWPSPESIAIGIENFENISYGIYTISPSDDNPVFQYQAAGLNPTGSSDGRYLAFEGEVPVENPLFDGLTRQWAIRIMLVGFPEVVTITSELQGICRDPHWKPGGMQLVYRCWGIDNGSRAYITDVATATTLLLPELEEPLRQCSRWSPDGNHIAFIGSTAIHILDLQSFTYEQIPYPADIADTGVRCLEWLW